MKTTNLTLFYDGLCPLCSREINHYRKIDKDNRLAFVDISKKSFNEDDFNLKGEEYFKNFHVQDKDGEFITGVDAFVAIWDELNCFQPLSCLAKNKLARPAFDLGYSVFTKVRPFLRRKDCDDDGVCVK